MQLAPEGQQKIKVLQPIFFWMDLRCTFRSLSQQNFTPKDGAQSQPSWKKWMSPAIKQRAPAPVQLARHRQRQASHLQIQLPVTLKMTAMLSLMLTNQFLNLVLELAMVMVLAVLMCRTGRTGNDGFPYEFQGRGIRCITIRRTKFLSLPAMVAIEVNANVSVQPIHLRMIFQPRGARWVTLWLGCWMRKARVQALKDLTIGPTTQIINREGMPEPCCEVSEEVRRFLIESVDNA